MKKKFVAFIMVCTLALASALPSHAAVIAPETAILDSLIGDLNINNRIYSLQIGEECGEDSVISPTTLVQGIDAAVLNIINNIVDIDVSVEENLVKKLLAGEADIGGTLFNSAPFVSNYPDRRPETSSGWEEENSEFSSEARTMLRLCNDAREKAGLSPLKLDITLCNMAEYKSKNMAKYGFSHEGSYGTLRDLLEIYGVSYRAAGENIACGTGGYTLEEIFEGWMNSPAHRDNILGNYTRLGFAMFRDKSSGVTFYTQEFISK